MARPNRKCDKCIRPGIQYDSVGFQEVHNTDQQVQVPTTSHTNEEVEEFCNEIIQNLDNNNNYFKYLTGDFSAEVREKTYQEQCIENYIDTEMSRER